MKKFKGRKDEKRGQQIRRKENKKRIGDTRKEKIK